MNVSPTQLVLQAASPEVPAVQGRSSQASVPAADPATAPVDRSAAPTQAVASSAQFSTDMRVDGQHQVYYEFVDKSTGDVVFEIPPEALREIGESLHLPLEGDSTAHGFDVKS